MEKKACETCKTPYAGLGRKYCSDACYHAANRIQTICGYCSKAIDIPRWKAEDKNYCSDECKRAAKLVIPESKACSKCEIEKPQDEFSTQGMRANGTMRRHSICKECQKDHARKYRQENLEKVRARMREQHRRNKDRYYPMAREWKAKNPDKVKAQKKEWDANIKVVNPEYHREKYQRRFEGLSEDEKRQVIAQWNESHDKDKAKAHRQARRARMYETQVEIIRPSDVFERDGYICYLCGLDLSATPEKAEVEHLIPLSRGGTHTYDNVATSCRRCNQRKKTKTPDECLWAKHRLALALVSR